MSPKILIAESLLVSSVHAELLEQIAVFIPGGAKAEPTRDEWAAACREFFSQTRHGFFNITGWKNVFVYRGGKHVAVHLTGESDDRDFLFTAPEIADWN